MPGGHLMHLSANTDLELSAAAGSGFLVRSSGAICRGSAFGGHRSGARFKVQAFVCVGATSAIYPHNVADSP
ncbi:unnamed protein product, partial [Iphiclides podalirius]